MVCGKSLDTATLKRSLVLENRISILSLDAFLLWIFIELNSLSTLVKNQKIVGGECVNLPMFYDRLVIMLHGKDITYSFVVWRCMATVVFVDLTAIAMPGASAFYNGGRKN
jgi:hypothetical protein